MRKIYLSLFVMALTVMMTAAPVAAYFTAQANVINNTFSTGTLGLRLFYDCSNVEEQRYGFGHDRAVVECPIDGDGSLERDALKYDAADGATEDAPNTGDIYNLEGDWTPFNGWWAGLSSAIDHTLIYPGWSASTPPWQDSDLLSVGNSGDLPLDLTMTLSFEAYQQYFEGHPLSWEPRDGEDPGGDRVDPRNDFGWVNFLGREYNTDLAEAINLEWERVDNDGNALYSGSGTLADIIAGAPLDLGSLEPNEVAYVRFNWDMPEDAGDEYQGLVFDYSIGFDAIQAGATPSPSATPSQSTILRLVSLG